MTTPRPARRTLRAAVVALTATGLGASGLLAGTATAAPALPTGCTANGSTVTCTYGPGQFTFAQPAGVTSVRVRIVGGSGGKGGDGIDSRGNGTAVGAPGGSGAVITGSVPVTASGLVVTVGAHGNDGAPTGLQASELITGAAGGASAAGAGGKGGGGRLGGSGGGGGGASAVRAGGTDGFLFAVAAGGGGGGGTFDYNRGGASGDDLNYGGNNGGQGGAADEFGYMGLSTDANDSVVQQTGGGNIGGGQGPNGGSGTDPGQFGDRKTGGGGGGGGGTLGGGAGETQVGCAGGGGAGGSTLTMDGGSLDTRGNPDGAGQVTITYDVPAATTSVRVRGGGTFVAGGQRITFALDARSTTPGTMSGRAGATGGAATFASRTVTSVTRQGATATVSGTARTARGATGPFTITVTDRPGGRDQASITVGGRTTSGTLTGGDVVLS